MSALFEDAVEKVVAGRIDALRELLDKDPSLVHARSAAKHRATLLHYVAANGVESERQLTPPNAVEVAKVLLDAGAKVDALAETYGGGPGQTTLNLLVSSVHPFRAGVQADLVEVLLDAGAAINGLPDDGSPVRVALMFGYVGAARTLERRGCRIGDFDVAAGLGNVAAMERMLAENNHAPGPEFMEEAFTNACGNGQIAAAKLLLDRGFDINRQLQGHGTGLHHAIMHGEGGGAPDGRLDVVHFLIENGADQNVRHGQWNATAIDYATYTGRAEIVEYLIEKARMIWIPA